MVYPDNLPCPLRAGYDINPENNILRTQMVSGRARQRVQYTSIPAYVDLAWIFTAAQAQVFESWSEAVGADWFQIKLKTPLGYYLQDCRFMETPQGPKLTGGDLWSYRAKVEMRDRAVIDSSYGEFAPEYLLLSDIIDIALNREWPE